MSPCRFQAGGVKAQVDGGQHGQSPALKYVNMKREATETRWNEKAKQHKDL